MSQSLFPRSVLDALRISPGLPAFEHGPRIVTRGAVLATVRRMAAGMRAAGLGPGQGVAMLTTVSPEAYAAHLAAHTLGCRVTGPRPGWSKPQLAHALCGQIDAVVVDASATPPDLPFHTATVFSLGERPGAVDLVSCAGDGRPLAVWAGPEDIARVSYTSGSTGRPKGCAHTYRSFTVAHQPSRWSPALTRLMANFQRCLIYDSLSSPVMMTYLGRCLVTGGTVIIPDGGPEPLFPHAIERHRITATLMPPPRLHAMLRALRDRPADLGSLRALVLGGSPAAPSLLSAAMERLGPVVWLGYGQGEAGMVSLLTPDDIIRHRGRALVSVGRPLPAVEVSVRDENNHPVRRGAVGEICVRGPHVMAGYWGEPELTGEVLRNGWLHTRDLGYLDPDGYLCLTGRTRDVIMVNAEVCYAGAVERVLSGHPDVDQACVIGVPDEQTGEAVHAFVVPAGERIPDREELFTLVRGMLSAASVPKAITVVRDIPVTAGGKPDKRALLAWYVRPAVHLS